MTVVVDASIWVDLLPGALPSDLAEQIASDDCVNPLHVDFEVGAALVRAGRRDDAFDADTVRVRVRRFAESPLRREYVADDPVKALDLLDDITYADAWYVAMARRRTAPIMTVDAGMAEGARIAGVHVIGVD